MKFAVILPDGAHDEPLPALGGLTPLEVANVPHLDWVARHGRLGRAVTIPTGFTPGTDVGTLTLLGFDPHLYYTGRAPLEAAAKGLRVRADQLIFRCNFVHVADGRMTDFTAGHIEPAHANRLVQSLNEALGVDGCEFHAGVSYRNLLLLGHAGEIKVKCQPPHDVPDQPVADHWPVGAGAERVMQIMERAARVLADHPVNRERVAAGHHPATNIWLWGQGRPTQLEPFSERHGLRGAVITAVDLIRGMAVCTGMDLIEVPGATGYIDTDYDAKGRAAVRALDDYDIVFVHVEAADEAGHLGDAREKVKALERIDEAVVGPVLEALRRRPEWRILVAADHPTPASTRAHSAVPPLFAFAGTGVEAVERRPFTEKDAAGGIFLDPGHPIMRTFLGQ
ncbi:MAG: cofactor-independent phosphoglycerate mutase [Deltaproteobacteria bacterium]|nr:cofactor-independent phosphoglycerate mutase [Deltaproteobacteria bacterium]